MIIYFYITQCLIHFTWDKLNSQLLSPWNWSSLRPSQHVLLPPRCLPRWRLLFLCWWAAAHAWCHAGWRTATQWVNGPSPVWWNGRGLGCSTGSPWWWTVVKDAFQWLGTPEPETTSREFVTITVHSLNSWTDKCALILWPMVPLIVLLPGMGETGGQKGAPWGCCRQQPLCCQNPRRTPAGQQHYPAAITYSLCSILHCQVDTEVSFQSYEPVYLDTTTPLVCQCILIPSL